MKDSAVRTTGRWRRRHLGRRAVASVLVVSAATTALVLATGSAEADSQASPGSASTLHVSGTHIVTGDGSPFVPYGTVVPCASFFHDPSGHDLTTDQLCTGDDKTHVSGVDMIRAAAGYWHMNIVRLQLAPEHWFTSTGAMNTAYVDMVDKLVDLAHQLGMVTTITLQEENVPGGGGPVYPVASSVNFWKSVANHYENDPQVFFDLFNEPRMTQSQAGSEDTVWNLWRNGGRAPDDPAETTYVGMQQLIDSVRDTGATNVVIAEAPHGDTDLSQIASHQLQGDNVAYGDEPNLNKTATAAQREHNLGQYAAKFPIVPEAFLDNVGSGLCDPNSPADLPPLLSYLANRSIGLVFWSLVPGAGIVGTDLEHPTSYPSDWNQQDCPGDTGVSATNTAGDGQLIHDFFVRQSTSAN